MSSRSPPWPLLRECAASTIWPAPRSHSRPTPKYSSRRQSGRQRSWISRSVGAPITPLDAKEVVAVDRYALSDDTIHRYAAWHYTGGWGNLFTVTVALIAITASVI